MAFECLLPCISGRSKWPMSAPCQLHAKGLLCPSQDLLQTHHLWVFPANWACQSLGESFRDGSWERLSIKAVTAISSNKLWARLSMSFPLDAGKKTEWHQKASTFYMLGRHKSCWVARNLNTRHYKTWSDAEVVYPTQSTWRSLRNLCPNTFPQCRSRPWSQAHFRANLLWGTSGRNSAEPIQHPTSVSAQIVKHVEIIEVDWSNVDAGSPRQKWYPTVYFLSAAAIKVDKSTSLRITDQFRPVSGKPNRVVHMTFGLCSGKTQVKDVKRVSDKSFQDWLKVWNQNCLSNLKSHGLDGLESNLFGQQTLFS